MECYEAVHKSPVAGELTINATRDARNGEGYMRLQYKDGAHDITKVRFLDGYPDALGASFWFAQFTELLIEIADEYAGSGGAKNIKPFSDKFMRNWLTVIGREDFEISHWVDECGRPV